MRSRWPDRFNEKEQNSSVRRQPVICRCLGKVLDGQTDSVKKNRIRLSVQAEAATLLHSIAMNHEP